MSHIPGCESRCLIDFVVMNTVLPDDPRSSRSREAIIAAVLAILEEDGPGGITHLRVAERAGVGRATVYRHWPQPADLLREVVDRVPVPFLDQPGGTFRERLRASLRRMRDDFSQPILQTVIASMIDKSMHDDAANELREAKTQKLRERTSEALAEALRTGELVGEPDAEELVSRLIGPVFFRLVMEQRKVSDGYIDRLITETLAPFTP
jgi:AcrR family transcriptional regulator